MAQRVSIDPVTRIEGHLKVEVEVDGGRVVDARASGTMFRGLELILRGRDPRDAPHITQRICGVCSVEHGITSVLSLDNAFGVRVPRNGRIVRNLLAGLNMVMSHITHFYHLAGLDYVKGPEVPPFVPRYEGDYRLSQEANERVVRHYVEALTVRRKAHEAAAVLGAKIPHVTALTAGGVTENVSLEKMAKVKSYLKDIASFVDNAYLPDAMAVVEAYQDYFEIGAGHRNLLAYGAFPLTDEEDSGGQNQFFKRGRYSAGQFAPVELEKVAEDVRYSRFDDRTSHLHPAEGATRPAPGKRGAYSWLKAPRYDGQPYEVGPLARMWINRVPAVVNLGDKAFSVLGRHYARAVEASLLVREIQNWVDQLVPGEPCFAPYSVPKEGKGVGLTEAARGALGHWIEVRDYRIHNYQAVVPTTWNFSPRDDKGVRGPLEEALVGTPVKDPNQPVEVVRVIRSFDPCLACAVHVLEVKESDRRLREFQVL
ncbi:MAG: nickel-dependent hydrogenase large subunit [Moorellales bacterium]